MKTRASMLACSLTVTLLGILAVSGSASAQPTTTTQSGTQSGTSVPATMPPVVFDQSCAKTAVTQSELDQCAATELREVQAQLGQALATEQSHSSARLVRAAQAAFSTFEKAECKAQSKRNTGGSIYPLVFDECEVVLTVQRVQDVRQFNGTAEEG